MAETGPDPQRFRDLMLDTEPGFEEVMVCVFDIQRHERRTYRVLLENPDSTVAKLADVLDRDRSNVNRSLSTCARRDWPNAAADFWMVAGTSISTPPRRYPRQRN